VSTAEHHAEAARSADGPATAFATTEHFNLQTARSITVSESNGRASIYLAALSSNLIALAFIGQMSRLGVAFYAFALILLPVLAFVGAVTFVRLVQSSIEDLAYAHRIGLLRNYYLQIAPELEPYIVVVRGTRSAPPSAWQLTLTVAGMVAVVNSVVIAACAGLVLQASGAPSLAIPAAVGAVIGVGTFSLHERHHRNALHAYRPDAVDRAAIFVAHAP
jgi:phosphate/sulfate permease